MVGRSRSRGRPQLTSVRPCGHDGAAAFAEADPPCSGAFAVPPKDHGIAVLEEGAHLAIAKIELHLAALAQLQQRASLLPASGPESVPEPSRSPGCRLQPLTVWCATSCATVQYASAKFDPINRAPAHQPRASSPFAARPRARDRSRPAPDWPPSRGKATDRDHLPGAHSGARNGASASIVTIHGDSVLAKFFDRKGPSGWYSQPGCRARSSR